MYESKYKKFITKSNSRFAEEHEILESLKSADSGAAGLPVLYKDGKCLLIMRIITA